MNVLKTNNRFSALLENNRHYNSPRVGISRYNKYKSDTKSIKINHANININDFPVLIDTCTTDKVCDVTTNYITKLLHQTITESEKGEILPYGWIVITPNKYKTIVKPNITINPSWENAMNSLVKLYNKRKDEYIAMWGEETYENVFLFPNYDYNYDYDEDEYEDEYEDYNDDEYDEYYN